MVVNKFQIEMMSNDSPPRPSTTLTANSVHISDYDLSQMAEKNYIQLDWSWLGTLVAAVFIESAS